MGIPQSTFLIFSSILTAGLIWAYSAFVQFFSNDPILKIQISELKENVEKERFQKMLAEYRLRDFQQTVATDFPHALNDKEKRTLAAVNLSTILREPSSVPKFDSSRAQFESIKEFFKKKEYKETIEKSKKLLDQFPTSFHVIETYFLLAESFFLVKEYKKCIEIIDLMVEVYPENDLTGFILLRMGQISELNNHPTEAKEIYTTVSTQFQNSLLKTQAGRLLRKFE